MKKRHLKKRILTNIFVVLTCSMVISSLAGYLYFAEVVRKQQISDERTKLQQVTGQIEYMAEDIENFARSIIVDDVIRAELEHQEYETELLRLKSIETIAKRLVFYNSLRTSIGSSFVEKEDGARYSSSNYGDEDYIRRKFEGVEISKYKQQSKLMFSDPYYGVDTGNIQQVVCYRSEILDIHNFGSRQGTLYLEVYLEYFLKQIRAYAKEYENVCLIGNEKNVIYEQGEEGLFKDYLGQENVAAIAGVHQKTGGYLICEEIGTTGWNLCVMVSSRYLWKRSNFVFYFFIISFLISLALIILSTSRILERVIRPITRLSEQMEQIDYYRLDMGEMVYTQDEIQTLYECFGKMLAEIQQSIQERMEYEKQKKEMEFDIMLSQINPHYLYNVLNTVVYLAAAEKNEKIVKIVNALIYTLQETLNLGERDIYTTISKELDLTVCYITIQKYRYQDMFEVTVSCDDELRTCQVPKTIIQPLVENAILHGILPSEEKGTVEIEIKKEPHTLVITVADNGVGISDRQLDNFTNKVDVIYEKNGRKHIGISNVRDRIRYLYGEGFGMDIRVKEGGGTIVTLRMPLKETEAAEI